MTSEACREQRAALGAFALGTADPAEALALRAHLDGCADCRAELRELTSVAGALGHADPERVLRGAALQPPEALAERVLDRLAAERVTRHLHARRRVVMAGAAALAIAAAVAGFVLVAPGTTNGTRVVFPTTSGVNAAATLRARAAGTEVAFHVSGLHTGDVYWLWVTGADGDRIAAGTFRGTGSRATNLVMTAALPLADARRIWVTDDHDKVVLDQRLPARA